jgi:hypothetical protein
LAINREKSGIRRPVQFTCLGFDFVPTYRKGERGKYQLVFSKKGCPEGIPMEGKAETKAENHHPKNHTDEL